MQNTSDVCEPSAKRKRQEDEERSWDGIRDRQQTFGHSNVSGNGRAHFGHQYNHYHGTVLQGASFESGPAALRPADRLMFEEMGVRRATIKLAHGNTCQWLFERPEYKQWRDSSLLPDHHGFFWIRGKPGAGKSTLMKCAANHADKALQDDVRISFFFNARGALLERSTEGMYRSLLHQLLEQRPLLEEVFHARRAMQLASWPIELLQELLHNAVLFLGHDQLTCHIDALDECDEADVRDMVDFFEDVGSAAVSTKVQFRVCLSSRHYPRISIARCIHLILEGLLSHEHDIEGYVQNKLKVPTLALREDLANEIRVRARGVFLWVVLVVRLLNEASDRGNSHDIRRRLEGIPDGVHKLFGDAILERGPDDTTYLKPILLWILFATHPLKPLELYHALMDLTKINSTSTTRCDEPSHKEAKDFILNASKGLADFTTSTRDDVSRVQFIHEAVRDYLIHSGISRLDVSFCSNPSGLGHDFVKQECKRYLLAAAKTLQFPHDVGNVFSKATRQRRAHAEHMFPFLHYACRGLVHHAEMAQVHGIPQHAYVQTFPLDFFISYTNLVERSEDLQYFGSVNAAYIFSSLNTPKLLQLELDRITHEEKSVSNAIDSCRGYFGSALAAAAARGHTRSAKALIDAGVDVNVEGGIYGTALQAACANDHTQIVNMLLETGAQINVAGGYYGPALRAAAYKGNEEVVSTLLSSGAEVNASGGYYGNALMAASYNGQYQVVRLLLDAKADVNARGRSHNLVTTAVRDRLPGRSEQYLKQDIPHANILALLKQHGAHDPIGDDLAKAERELTRYETRWPD